MTLLGYGMLKKEGLTIYQAMFLMPFLEIKKYRIKSLIEEVYALTDKEKLILIELNSNTFSNKFFSCMKPLAKAIRESSRKRKISQQKL